MSCGSSPSTIFAWSKSKKEASFRAVLSLSLILLSFFIISWSGLISKILGIPLKSLFWIFIILSIWTSIPVSGATKQHALSTNFVDTLTSCTFSPNASLIFSTSPFIPAGVFLSFSFLSSEKADRSISPLVIETNFLSWNSAAIDNQNVSIGSVKNRTSSFFFLNTSRWGLPSAISLFSAAK